MAFFGALFRFLLIAGAALLGNYVGDLLAGPAQPDPTRAAVLGALPLRVQPTNLVPAIGLALLAGPPRVVYAFASGVVIAMLVGDRYAHAFDAPLDRMAL